MLFAVGDGNHSWRRPRHMGAAQGAAFRRGEENDPLRYALVEVVNLYDNGIAIHPIHRVLFNVDVPVVLNALVSILNKQGQDASMIYTRSTRVQPRGRADYPFRVQDVQGSYRGKKAEGIPADADADGGAGYTA